MLSFVILILYMHKTGELNIKRWCEAFTHAREKQTFPSIAVVLHKTAAKASYQRSNKHKDTFNTHFMLYMYRLCFFPRLAVCCSSQPKRS